MVGDGGDQQEQVILEGALVGKRGSIAVDKLVRGLQLKGMMMAFLPHMVNF